MDTNGIRNYDIRENELEIFCDLLVGNLITKYEFTIGKNRVHIYCFKYLVYEINVE